MAYVFKNILFVAVREVRYPLQHLVDLSALLDAYLSGSLWSAERGSATGAAAKEREREEAYEAWMVQNLKSLISAVVQRT